MGLIIGVLSFSCNDAFRPANVLSEEKMAEVITELQIAEAKVKNLRIRVDSAKVVYANYELEIFERLGITDKAYLSSLEYYLENSRAMSRINQAVIDTLTARQAQAEEISREFKPEESVPVSAAAKEEGEDVKRVINIDSVKNKAKLRRMKPLNGKPIRSSDSSLAD